MPYLEAVGLTKSYASIPALRGVSFSMEKGETVVLLGPSGCGKTTLLNLMAGFLRLDGGCISLAGMRIDALPPERRGMAMVFQSYALFPHMTIGGNVGFGLEMARMPRREREGRIAEILDLVRLPQMADRYPHELSGGQQQRVALARALVVKPAVLLLDEPLSNLDSLLRKTMQSETRQIIDVANTTTIVVTHDQEEALVMADRVILMSGGGIVQVGTPRELYEYPRTAFAAEFMGASNVIPLSACVQRGDSLDCTSAFGLVMANADAADQGRASHLAIRPDRIAVNAELSGENSYRGLVESIAYRGSSQRMQVRVQGYPLVVDAPIEGVHVRAGDQVTITWRAADTRVLQR